MDNTVSRASRLNFGCLVAHELDRIVEGHRIVGKIKKRRFSG